MFLLELEELRMPFISFTFLINLYNNPLPSSAIRPIIEGVLVKTISFFKKFLVFLYFVLSKSPNDMIEFIIFDNASVENLVLPTLEFILFRFSQILYNEPFFGSINSSRCSKSF